MGKYIEAAQKLIYEADMLQKCGTAVVPMEVFINNPYRSAMLKGAMQNPSAPTQTAVPPAPPAPPPAPAPNTNAAPPVNVTSTWRQTAADSLGQKLQNQGQQQGGSQGQ